MRLIRGDKVQNAIYPSLKDKVVFISGGASGIGESIVRHFSEQGCKVGFIDIADDAASKLIADLGPKATLHYEHCDVTDIAALKRAIEAVRKALGFCRRRRRRGSAAHRRIFFR